MYKTIIAALAAVTLNVGSLAAEPLVALTSSSNTPFSRGMDKEMPGFLHEYMLAVAAEAGHDLEIEYDNWSNAQERTQSGSGLLAFGIIRNDARELNYSWITPLITVERSFAGLVTAPNSFDEASTVNRIAARGVYYRGLTGRGLENVVEGETLDNLAALYNGDVDAVYTITVRTVFLWTQELGFPIGELGLGVGLGASDIWLAASPGYPEETLKSLHAANLRLRENGTFAALHKRYFGDLAILDRAKPAEEPTTLASIN